MEPAEILPSQNGAEKGHIEYGENLDQKSEKSNADLGVETGAEKVEQASEAAAAIADSGFPTILPTPVATATPTQDATDTQDDMSFIAGTPLVANDEDLIEKEWVKKAKEIVNDTKEDPYTREEAVNQLQKDYQQKRGRGLGEA